jgi:hypothetical protein
MFLVVLTQGSTVWVTTDPRRDPNNYSLQTASRRAGQRHEEGETLTGVTPGADA